MNGPTFFSHSSPPQRIIQQAGNPEPTKLGLLSFTCDWIGNSTDLESLEGVLAPCNGLISLTSGKQAKNKGMPKSTAAIVFWAPVTVLVDAVVDASVKPLVLRTSGSFPKAESIVSFTWAEVSNDLNPEGHPDLQDQGLEPRERPVGEADIRVPGHGRQEMVPRERLPRLVLIWASELFERG